MNANANWKSHLKLVASGWALLLFLGLFQMASYSTRNDHISQPPKLWPLATEIKAVPTPSLIVFLHPHCPCSVATVRELERMMPKLINRVRVVAVFIQPETESEEWVQTSLYFKAKRITGVRVITDYNYKEADAFDAQVSGQAFFYNQNGVLVLAGGLTPARGHEGESVGQSVILNFLDGRTSEVSRAQAFGCALRKGSAPWTDEVSANGQ